MTQPSLAQVFTDIDSEDQIDQFYHQKDLEKLVELCLIYNNTTVEEKINIDQVKHDKWKMLITLWMKGVTIPEYLNLGYGEPYNTMIKDWLEKEVKGTNPEDTPIYKM